METILKTERLNSIYQSLSDLNLSELEFVMQQIIHLRKKKLSTVLSKNETMLFRKINKGAPKFIQKRYESLIKKKNEETLSQAEYEELLELTSYMESLQVERLENLIELAKFQNISLDELIDQLELKPKINVL